MHKHRRLLQTTNQAVAITSICAEKYSKEELIGLLEHSPVLHKDGWYNI